jgi:hypothetical protein
LPNIAELITKNSTQILLNNSPGYPGIKNVSEMASNKKTLHKSWPSGFKKDFLLQKIMVPKNNRAQAGLKRIIGSHIN